MLGCGSICMPAYWAASAEELVSTMLTALEATHGPYSTSPVEKTAPPAPPTAVLAVKVLPATEIDVTLWARTAPPLEVKSASLDEKTESMKEHTAEAPHMAAPPPPLAELPVKLELRTVSVDAKSTNS
eukprot:472100-Rhodomonas_salina.3